MGMRRRTYTPCRNWPIGFRLYGVLRWFGGGRDLSRFVGRSLRWNRGFAGWRAYVAGEGSKVHRAPNRNLLRYRDSFLGHRDRDSFLGHRVRRV